MDLEELEGALSCLEQEERSLQKMTDEFLQTHDARKKEQNMVERMYLLKELQRGINRTMERSQEFSRKGLNLSNFHQRMQALIDRVVQSQKSTH